MWQQSCLPGHHKEYAATLSADSSLQRRTNLVWLGRRAFHYLASVCQFSFLLGAVIVIVSVYEGLPVGHCPVLTFYIRFVLTPPSAKRGREGGNSDDPSNLEDDRQPSKKARRSLLVAKRNLGPEKASTASSGSDAPIDLGVEDLVLGEITCPKELLLELPAPPKKATAYTLKFIVPFPAEELKRRLTQIFLPTQ